MSLSAAEVTGFSADGPIMRKWHRGLFIAMVVSIGCDRPGEHIDAFQPITPARAASIEEGARTFAQAVAQDVSRDGPAAWQSHFAADAAFFMVAEGRLVFPNRDAATKAIEELTRSIRHIELRWGEPLRVDPVAPGLAVLAMPYSEIRVDIEGRRVDETGFFTALAEYRNGRWQFRNAHWSVAGPPPVVR